MEGNETNMEQNMNNNNNHLNYSEVIIMDEDPVYVLKKLRKKQCIQYTLQILCLLVLVIGVILVVILSNQKKKGCCSRVTECLPPPMSIIWDPFDLVGKYFPFSLKIFNKLKKKRRNNCIYVKVMLLPVPAEEYLMIVIIY